LLRKKLGKTIWRATHLQPHTDVMGKVCRTRFKEQHLDLLF